MKPYYQRGGVTIYHGDCREVLPTLESNSVDLILTDPPYGVSWQSNFRTLAFSAIEGDESTDAAIYATELALRCLKDGRHVYLFGKYELSCLPLCEHAELIWDKGTMSMGNLTSPWGSQHENIQFSVYQSSKAHKEFGKGRLSARLRKGTILSVARPAAELHPTEKPVNLLRQLIESSSCFGETVLDYFSGIGSTLVAAQREGRRAIGIELDEKYCEIAAKRLSQEVFEFPAEPSTDEATSGVNESASTTETV